tara:strand:- start:179 stop:328 length:150 start_codon:yes stop_codon:yes gene_type:complete
MLVTPDLKDIVRDKQDIIEKQKFQIKMLQKDLHKMFIKLKEINASVEKK